MFSMVYYQRKEKYETSVALGLPEDVFGRNRCMLLVPEGNRLVYTVEPKVLEKTAIIELGFLEQR